MTKQYTIERISAFNDDGSQDIWVEGRPNPFHVTAAWLAGQPHGVEVGDGLTHTGNTLTVDPAQPKEALTEPSQGPPVKHPMEGLAEDVSQKKTDGGEGSEVGSKAFQPNYRANPVEVEAFEIVSVAGMTNSDGSLNLALSNGTNVIAHPDMLARITPALGDYWVVQEDGYVYLNPKAVFERKYAQIKE